MSADSPEARTAAHEIGRLLRPDLRGRSPYGAPQLDVPVRLNTNENSYPVPEVIVRAVMAALEDDIRSLNRYPDREFTDLRAVLTSYLGQQSGVRVRPEQVWAGNGSNEVLSHLVQAFGGHGRTALGFTPSYSMHPIITATLGTTWADGMRESGTFELTAEAAAEQARAHDPSIVFLCSPNNPTGTALPFEVIGAVLDAAPNAVVVVDEAYAEFARPGTRSALTLLEGNPRLVVTRTMSKAFAFAGGRLGYLVADPALVDALRLVRLPYHLSTPTQTIARVALQHADLLLATVEAIKAERDRIVDGLAGMGLAPVASDSNFVLFGGLADAHATWQALLEAGVLVRDVGIPHHLRVTAGTPAETSAFLEAMGRLAPEHRLEQEPA
ncbi:histidinol-phosphate aminotransferase [Intrasporangium chromatireducens Q5-1]|uniref:Histidinol-phosphate aminotransferase n=1 Tax=Intrasporangium chromatireducens Q5-1 TaxID=584657 RepID=W9GIA8_9MICO|nr:histidinol-phosphate transaminase [Intrasporangium chromatireducens]EWT04902.1 histidinol-phosphate aminotransferase [Intrasporangium chromatireducens Q5-1]